ncbi:hypothetical protein M2444_004705 [Paenibacillus sp. PastF-3]|uniref:hypothetical protein n=1 Tax=unclassified Paenibacillus TaxID=185978 RepID=UPI000BA111E5|nr:MULTISPECIES: hypothetical protein [unclassified Paenibacillus]MBY3621153.1 hypothetical protein [Acinetobacter sp. CUI P1]MDH6372876.1 hypothetical protein [Paenibacillus sp. PastF-3]OZQ85777.1 hypothetical protein CA598_20145 [Paenibacillus sp. VTT E-133291]
MLSISDLENKYAGENIPIFELVKNHLHGTVLDIFTLIMDADQGISKTQIQEEFKRYTSSIEQTTKFRYPVSMGVAKLEGAMMVEIRKEGTADLLYLTPFGETAKEILGDLFEVDQRILRGSKIAAAIYQEGILKRNNISGTRE